MKDFILDMLRGVVIGVANIIPGVSGGTMMVSMGVYDQLIYCITHLFKSFKKSIKILLPYVVGMLAGVVVLASLLKICFERYELPTYTCYVGMILGGIGPLLKAIDRKKINVISVLLFVLFFALIIVMALTGDVVNPDAIPLNVGTILLLLVLGAIASATMIIPGVSGSMVLMLLGYYTPILNAVSALKDAVFQADFHALLYPMGVLLPFVVGVVGGLFGVAKLIEWLISRFPTHTYCAVLGLVLASPVAIITKCNLTGINTVNIIISIVTFAIGFTFALWLSKHSKKEEPVHQ